MTPSSPIVPERWRRTVRHLAVIGVVLSGIGLVGEIASALPPGTPASGSMKLVPATGDSSTVFSLQFDTPAAPQVCPGDNTASYVWHTFITPAGNDPADFVYSASGNLSGEPAFTNNLANAIGTRSRNNLPGLGDGLVVQPSNLTFSNTALFATLTPGDYTVGIACARPDASFAVQTERFWSGQITIVASQGAGPNNFTYAMATTPVPSSTSTTTTSTTTTTTTTTTTVPPAGGSSTSSTTTTVAGGATTTTVPCPTGTTTTLAGATTTTAATTTTLAGATTTTNPCVTTTTTAPAGQGVTTTTVRLGSGGATLQAGGTGTTGNSLANTGTNSSTPIVLLWAVLLLAFGRMVILMARPIRVIDRQR